MQNKLGKISALLLFALVFCFSAAAQNKPSARSQNVKIAITDSGATSELLPIPVITPPELTDAKIGFKYFGVEADSDTSIVLILKGTKSIYSNGNFGVRFIVDDIPLKADKYRIVEKVDKNATEETLHFYITSEEIAWLATGDKISLSVFNTETNKLQSTFSFSPASLKEFKDFARSILLIKSQY